MWAILRTKEIKEKVKEAGVKRRQPSERVSATTGTFVYMIYSPPTSILPKTQPKQLYLYFEICLVFFSFTASYF